MQDVRRGEGDTLQGIVHVRLCMPKYSIERGKRKGGLGGEKEDARQRRTSEIQAQLFSWKLAPQERQVTVIFPLPRGTRSCWLQLGHLK